WKNHLSMRSRPSPISGRRRLQSAHITIRTGGCSRMASLAPTASPFATRSAPRARKSTRLRLSVNKRRNPSHWSGSTTKRTAMRRLKTLRWRSWMTDLDLKAAREAVARQREAIAAAARKGNGNIKRAAVVIQQELALAARYRAGELDDTQPVKNALGAIRIRQEMETEA